MRVVFAGTPEFAVPGLEVLIDSPLVEVVAVYTQPDRPAGRGKKPQFSAVKEKALEHDLLVLQPENLNSDHAIMELEMLKPDLIVVTAYGIILNQKVLRLPKKGCVNLHASLLPRWRGAAPIQRAIEAGDPVTGITLMKMDVGLDTGDMLSKVETIISSTDTTATLHDTLKDLSAELLEQALPALIEGSIQPERQNEGDATYAKKLSKAESPIDWTQSASQLQKRIHAFNPWPSVTASIKGNTIKLFNAITRDITFEEADAHSESPIGTILSANASGIDVLCGQGVLSIQYCQKPGGKAMPVRDFLNGISLTSGECFELTT